MFDARLARYAPLAGLVFFALAVVGTLVMGSTPDFVDEPAKIAEHYESNDGQILTGDFLYLLGGVFLLWFVGTLRTFLRAAEGLGGRVARTAFAGGVAGTTLIMAAAAIDAVGALRVQEQDRIDPQVAAVLYDLNSILFGLAAPMAFAVLVFGTALVSMRAVAMPRWHAWISVALAFAMLVPVINWLAMIVFIVWVGVTSVLLFMGARVVPTVPTATAPPPAV